MEKIYLHPFGIAAGLTSGIVYTVCAAAVVLWPQAVLKFFASWFHGIDLMSIAAPGNVTWGSFFLGLIGTVLFAYLVGLLFGWMYNLCFAHCRKRKWI